MSRTLHSLRPLHRSMRRNDMNRVHFRFTYNKHEVSAVFFIDEEPFKLMVYRIGVGVVVFDVRPGYKVATYLDGDYTTLRSILGIQRNSTTEWSPDSFFAYLDEKCIPKTAHPTTHECRPEHASQRFENDIEESEKIYFCGIIDWSMVRSAGEFEHLPQEANRRKTAALLGEEIAFFCEKHHISTKWTADPTDAQRVRHRAGIEYYITGSRRSVEVRPVM